MKVLVSMILFFSFTAFSQSYEDRYGGIGGGNSGNSNNDEISCSCSIWVYPEGISMYSGSYIYDESKSGKSKTVSSVKECASHCKSFHNSRSVGWLARYSLSSGLCKSSSMKGSGSAYHAVTTFMRKNGRTYSPSGSLVIDNKKKVDKSRLCSLERKPGVVKRPTKTHLKNSSRYLKRVDR